MQDHVGMCVSGEEKFGDPFLVETDPSLVKKMNEMLACRRLPSLVFQ